MVTTLELALKQYLDLIRALFAHTKKATEASADPHLQRSAGQQLFSLVEAAEGQREFRALVEATRDEFSADSMERTVGGLWDSPVQNFFRQSRIYQGIFQGEYNDDTSLVGAPLGTIQALLGHASSEVTRQIYLHAIPAQQRRAVEGVEKLLIGPKWTQIGEVAQRPN